MIVKLAEYRQAKGLSIRKLSKISGVSRTYISDIERDICENPSVEIICKLCKVLGVTPNDIISEEYWK